MSSESKTSKAVGSERAAQMAYWQVVGASNIESMMLDPKAKELDAMDRPEAISSIPLTPRALKEADVIELGAGMGRLTGQLAAACRSVLAVDFLQHCIDANREQHGHLGNITFECQDVNDMERDANSAHLVFSNWLLMYLDDAECRAFAAKTLSWTKPGGFLVFRESCFHQSGSAARPTANPSHYRDPDVYDAMFGAAESTTEDGVTWVWKLVRRARVHAYEVLKNNPNQIRWIFQKVTAADRDASLAAAAAGDADDRKSTTTSRSDHATSEELDSTQYTEVGILRYERIFGAGFVSTGGRVTTSKFLERLSLKPGMRVLDVGCGIGGGDFLMADTYGVHVVGIDLSSNMVRIANQRAQSRENTLVEFRVEDVTCAPFKAGEFDVIYSRDTLLHIGGKNELFGKFLTWLKPGGQLFISDYARGDVDAVVAGGDVATRSLAAKFTAYVEQRGYYLMTPAQYGELVSSVGFEAVTAEDSTALFVESLEAELARVSSAEEQAAFVRDFSQKDFDYIVSGWRQKLELSAAGLQKWAVIHARKPLV